jgi:hypothetical protein
MLVRLVDGSDGRVRKRRVLLGTSIEFELASIAICALKDRRPGWKVILMISIGMRNHLEFGSHPKMPLIQHCSAQLVEGRRLLLTVKTRLNEEGELKVLLPIKCIPTIYFPLIQVEAFFHRISSASSKKPTKQVKKPKPKPNPEFQSFVEELWAKDVDRVDPEMITLNWQAKLHKNQVADLSPDPSVPFPSHSLPLAFYCFDQVVHSRQRDLLAEANLRGPGRPVQAQSLLSASVRAGTAHERPATGQVRPALGPNYGQPSISDGLRLLGQA